MVQRNRFSNRRQQKHSTAPRPSTPREAPRSFEKKPPIQYGKPFILLEDANKDTFEFKGGAWVPYSMSIAACRQECQVNELPQKVNQMTRYEIRCPVSATS
jgi:hypothetical protein